MKQNGKWLRFPGLAVCAGIVSAICLSCSSNSFEGKIIAVEQDRNDPASARLVLFDPEKPEKEGSLVIKDLESTSAPSLSHDARHLFFQGKDKQEDPWQIWMLDLKKNKVSQITDLPENCTDPVSLPDGSLVFSRESQVKGVKVNDLWKVQRDGCCLTRLTYNPARNLYPTLLWEGRILYVSTEVYPEMRESKLMVMRPDGTKSELYSAGGPQLLPAGGGSESSDGFIYFISGQDQLARVQHRRPLHTFEHLSQGVPGSFASVHPLDVGGCLVSYRPSSSETFGLYRFEPDTYQAPVLLIRRETNLTDPVFISAVDPRPRILPSAVDPGNSTGLLMSQDIKHSMLTAHAGISGDSLAGRIRISTFEGELAVVEAKADGSFYIKVDAEIPLRFEALNNQGEVVRGPSDWIYLRPNERRACTGCHANPELAPRNIQPMAVKEDPIDLSAKKKETSQ
jgi:hypothetical protein